MTLTRLSGASPQLSEGLLRSPGSSVEVSVRGSPALPRAPPHPRPRPQRPTKAGQGLLRQQVAGEHLLACLGVILGLEPKHGLCLVLC